MKKILTFIGAMVVLASCNKDDNTDTFCNAVGEKDWAYVETVLVSEATNYTDTVWKNNAKEFAKTLTKKDCVDSAFARLNSPSVNETEVIIRYMVNDTAIQRIETLYINSTSGVLTFKRKYPIE